MKLKSLFSYRKWLMLFVNSGAAKRINDRTYLKLRYYAFMGRRLDLDEPETFNEKLQWLKLYDRRPEYTMMVDKYLVRNYIAEILGEEYLIPLLGVWDDPDEIDFDALPDQFVLKCNHNSGLGMCICTDKSKLDIGKVKKELRKGLKQNYYLTEREWPYKDVRRRIVAEKYMVDPNTSELRDYKFFCFNGKVKCFYINYDRFTRLRTNYYDREGNLLPFYLLSYPPDFSRKIDLPRTLDGMIAFAEAISKGYPFLRVDLYDVNGKIYFGELTFFPDAGLGEFCPEEWDHILGSWIELPGKESNRSNE